MTHSVKSIGVEFFDTFCGLKVLCFGLDKLFLLLKNFFFYLFLSRTKFQIMSNNLRRSSSFS